MSIYPSPDKLDSMESKYALVIIAAKRARQLKDGARRLTDSRATNVITAALEEIAEGAIIPREVEDAAVTAQQAALKPKVPTQEDIIGAGPVLATEGDMDSTSSQLAAFRIAEPELEEEELIGINGDVEDDVIAEDDFAIEPPILDDELDEDEEEDELITGIEDEEE